MKFSKIFITLPIIFLALMLISGIVFAADNEAVFTPKVLPGSFAGNNPAEFVSNVYQYALGLVGLAALGAIIFGSIKWMTSAGNPSAVEDAKGWIGGAIGGIALLAGAYLILQTINPRLVEIGAIEQSIESQIKIPTKSTSTFGFLLSTSTLLEGLSATSSLMSQFQNLNDTQAKFLLDKYNIKYGPSTNFMGLTPFAISKLGVIADDVGGQNVNILTYYRSEGNWEINLQKNGTLDQYFIDNLSVINLNLKTYTFPKLGHVTVVDKENHWQILINYQ